MFKKTKNRHPWFFVPTLYFAEGLPYVLVNTVAVVLYKRLQVPNEAIAFWTSWFYLPWVIKMLWGPLIDMYSTKRNWIICTQFLIMISLFFIAIGIKSNYFFTITMFFFLIIAFVSATHDISVDGYYMLSLTEKDQAFFVGIRAFFYRMAMLFGSGALIYLAGRLEETTGNIPLSWNFIFLGTSVIFCFIFLYHRFILPYPALDGKGSEKNKKNDADLINQTSTNAKTQFVQPKWTEIIISYFKQEKIAISVAFIVLYRFGEGLLLKLTSPFLLDTLEKGGMGLSTSQIGIAYGTLGLICLMAGGILGGWLISKYSLKRCIWPMAFLLNAPDLVYVYMAYNQNLPVNFIYFLVAVEQFGYGIGTTAFMYYLIQITGEKYKTSHFAISTGIMALGMMLPGLVSGYLQKFVGYPVFFIIVCIATIPGMALIPFLNFKEEDIQK